MLTVWQFKQWHLVQLTDGRQPVTTDEYRDGWSVFGEVAATEDAVSEIALKSSKQVLNEVDLKG